MVPTIFRANDKCAAPIKRNLHSASSFSRRPGKSDLSLRKAGYPTDCAEAYEYETSEAISRLL